MPDKKEKLQAPSRELQVKIGGNTYKISLPKTGQEIDIEVLKDGMTKGSYRNLLYGTSDSQAAYLSVSAIATFEILIPSLKNDLLIPLSELDMLQIKEVIKEYQKYYEWINKWREFINQDTEQEDGK